jgi:2-C-methyl-D-erythritol 4-phosphate cytidylyltransferase/2-C-methyl-D-erythritol 2,4-cyclodiphosphate synthase
MSVSAIIAAAGRGVRAGGALPKQLVDLGGGKTMVELSVASLMACRLIDEIVLAIPEDGDNPRVVSQRIAESARTAGNEHVSVVVVPGGGRRQDSVSRAFAAVSPSAEIVVIHDAARPFVSPGLIERTIQAASEHGAAVAAVPAVDTVKQIAPVASGGGHVVRATLPRETIYLAQTPQAFQREILAQALASAEDQHVTDEATLVERAGFTVHIVEGEAANFKVTTPDDLAAARARLAQDVTRPVTAFRVGTGYDLHRLVEGRPLILAGVRILHDRGLLGHSDADLVCHAVTDAILGAAGAGDIGRLFPDTDPRWKDADSIQLMRGAVDVIRAAGFAVGNVDVTIIAERPKLLPHLDGMRANLARALGVGAAAVSIKGKTNEQADATGRGEAMACHAVALLVRS